MATLIHAAGYVIVCLVLFFTLLAVIDLAMRARRRRKMKAWARRLDAPPRDDAPERPC